MYFFYCQMTNMTDLTICPEKITLVDNIDIWYRICQLNTENQYKQHE